MLRTTPPSARTAAPLIVVAVVPATNATTAATSSGVSKRLRRDVGRTAAKNCRSSSAGETPCCFARPSKNCATPSEAVGPTSSEFTVTPVPVVVSASPRAITTAVFPSSPRSIVWPLDSRTGAAHPRPRLARPEGPCWDLGCAALNAGGDDSIPDVRYHPRHDHPLAPRETCVLILSHP